MLTLTRYLCEIIEAGTFQLAINTNIWDHHLIRASNYRPLGVIPLLLSCHQNVLLNPLLPFRNLFQNQTFYTCYQNVVKYWWALLTWDHPWLGLFLPHYLWRRLRQFWSYFSIFHGNFAPPLTVSLSSYCFKSRFPFSGWCYGFFFPLLTHMLSSTPECKWSVCMLTVSLCSTSYNRNSSATITMCKWDYNAIQHCQGEFWTS